MRRKIEISKYYRFKYSAGYAGTDTEEIVEVPDSYTSGDVQELFDEWYEEQDTSYGDFEEISEDEAQSCGIEESYCD